jgi:hypothetical protein
LNEELFGVVEQTWVNGEKLFDGACPDGLSGRGKFLHLNKGSVLYHE